jgi:hypothetical protein
MVTGSVNVGSAVTGAIVKGGVPGRLNAMMSGPRVALALVMAARKDPGPESDVTVTVKVAASVEPLREAAASPSSKQVVFME